MSTLTIPEIEPKDDFEFDGRHYSSGMLAGVEIERSAAPSGLSVVHFTEYATTADHAPASVEVTDFIERDGTLRVGLNRHREDSNVWVRFSIDLDVEAARALHARLGEVLA